jgi:hypothetical protein
MKKKARKDVAKAVTHIDELQDSIEVAVNVKGEASWKVKLYFDEAGQTKALKRMEVIQNKLRIKYR